MTLKKILALLLTFYGLQFNTVFAQKTPSIKESTYGIAENSPDAVTFKLKNSPTGTRSGSTEFNVIKVTDTIPAVLNTRFGVEYYILHPQNTELKLIQNWIFPSPMKNNEGKEFTNIAYTIVRPSNKKMFSSFVFEEPFEMIKGKWIYQLSYKNKVIYEKVFVVQ